MAYDQQKWFEFMELARVALLQGQPINYKEPAIQLLVEPSFDNHIFLQLQVKEGNVLWYRKTWRKLDDAPKFSDPIENLKYIGRNITPTIQQENGQTTRETLQPIIAFINSMNIKPGLEQLGGFVLDGTVFTLTIGLTSTHITYKWHYLPEDWSDLQKLANMLSALNQEL